MSEQNITELATKIIDVLDGKDPIQAFYAVNNISIGLVSNPTLPVDTRRSLCAIMSKKYKVLLKEMNKE